MKFVDQVKVYIKAGHGGRGCVSFRREKYIPRGGPDGGDGGRGAHIIFSATKDLNTLLDIRYQQQYKADNGQHGMGKNMHGKNGKDCVIPVPQGTLIKHADSGEVQYDLTEDGQTFIAAKGGRGGLGNTNFKSSRHQTPRFAQPGEPGEEMTLLLELKLLADVGLIGLPNAGKSTLISVLSSAKPKIADYPFTTLKPVLGVVKYGGYKSFIVADIPGLIKGAHEGTGLGFQFLRHVERTSVLLHLVDISEIASGEPEENLESINRELALYSPALIKKPQAVVGTKLDIKGDSKRLDRLENYCKDKRYDFLQICAATGEGLEPLIQYLAKIVEQHKDSE